MNTFLILDLETTGFSPEKGDTIIDIGAILCDGQGILKRFQSLVHPGNVEVSEFVQTLTGISTEMLKDAPTRDVVLQEFKEFLGDYSELPIIGHNIQFDANFLNAYGFHFSQENYLDTNDFSTLLFPSIPSHSLEILSSYFQIEHVEKHRAMGDVLASYELFKILKKAYAQNLEIKFADKVTQLLSTSSWGGRHFFSLQIDDTSPIPVLTSNEENESISYYKPEKAKVYSYLKSVLGEAGKRFVAMPIFVEPQKALLHGLKDTNTKSTVILGGAAELESYREEAHTKEWENDFLLIEHPSHFLVTDKITLLLEKTTLSDAECVFALRMLFLDSKDAFIPHYRLKLTHRERSILSDFGLQQDDSSDLQTAFSRYIDQFAVVATSYYQYFHGTYALSFQRREHAILANAMNLEPQLIDASRNYYTQDGFRKSLERLTLYKVAIREFSTILASLDLTVTSTFEKITKHLLKLQKNQALLENFSEELKDLQVFFSRGVEALEKLYPTLDPEVTLSIQKHVRSIQDQLYMFLDDLDPEYWYYAKVYNNQLTLYKEPKEILPFVQHFLDKKSIVMVDSAYFENFSYLISPEEWFALEKEELHEIITSRIQIEEITAEEVPLLEKNDITFLETHLNHSNKTAVLCNTGAKLEKIFDTFYSAQYPDEYLVVSFGRTGGTHKVQYLFSNADRGCLVSKFSDYFQLPSTVEIDELILHSLPFPNVQGMYFESKYQNTFEKFTIPLTQKTMTEVFYKAVQITPEKSKIIKLYDSRMYLKDYGKQIVSNMYW